MDHFTGPYKAVSGYCFRALQMTQQQGQNIKETVHFHQIPKGKLEGQQGHR